jgi:hypothetical protein
LSRLTGLATGTDPLRNLQIVPADIPEELREFRPDVGILLEQQLLKLRAVDAYSLLQVGSEKVHDGCLGCCRAGGGRRPII